MEVLELRPSERVAWRVVGGPEEWIGTTVEWDLRQDGDYTIVLFKHQGWKEPVEFMNHCSTKWGSYLMGLKSLVETGEGRRAGRTDQRLALRRPSGRRGCGCWCHRSPSSRYDGRRRCRDNASGGSSSGRLQYEACKLT